MRTYLERINPEQRMARFYAVTVTPTLFGDWSVLREWGRIGQGGTLRESAYGSEAEAVNAARIQTFGKIRRGYRDRSAVS